MADTDRVLARRKEGWPPVVLQAREDVVQPLAACDCHDRLVWHPGEVMYVSAHELEEGRADIEAVSDDEAQTLLAKQTSPTGAAAVLAAAAAASDDTAAQTPPETPAGVVVGTVPDPEQADMPESDEPEQPAAVV